MEIKQMAEPNDIQFSEAAQFLGWRVLPLSSRDVSNPDGRARRALEWIKTRADKSEPNFSKRNAHYYAVDLADLGMVIVEKPRRDFGQKPWLAD